MYTEHAYLPPEVLAQVFSHSPVVEVCRLRRVTQHFRRVIDQNEATIALPEIESHRQRLAARL